MVDVDAAMLYAHDTGFDEGYEEGYEDGYQVGFSDGSAQNGKPAWIVVRIDASGEEVIENAFSSRGVAESWVRSKLYDLRISGSTVFAYPCGVDADLALYARIGPSKQPDGLWAIPDHLDDMRVANATRLPAWSVREARITNG